MIDLNYLSKVLSNKRSGSKNPKFLGYSRKRSTCEHCGKEDLSKSYVYRMPDGTTKCVGSKCANKFKDSFYDESNYEAVYDDLIAENPELRSDIELFKSRDPSGNFKYIKWQVKILKSGQAEATEIADVTDLFHRFVSLRPTRDPSGNPLPLPEGIENRDINFYTPSKFTSLRDSLFYIRDLSAGLSEQKKKYKTKAPSTEDAPVIYGEGDDKRFSVVYIKTKKASAFYGKGTKWCITMGFQSYWEDYEYKNDVFFFIVDKKIVDEIESKKLTEKEAPDLYKIAVQVHRDSDDSIGSHRNVVFWNVKDETVDYYKVKDYIGEEEFVNVINAIIPLALKHKKSPIAKLGSGQINYEELKDIFNEVKDYKSDSAKLSIFSKLVKDKNIDNEMLRYIFVFAVNFYASDCIKYNELSKFYYEEDTKEFKLWKINNRVPITATVDSIRSALSEESSQIRYLMNNCLDSKEKISNEDIIRAIFLISENVLPFYDNIFYSLIKKLSYLDDSIFKRILKIKNTSNRSSILKTIAASANKEVINLLLSKRYYSLLNKDIKEAIYENPNTEKEIIQKAIKKEKNETVFSKLLERLDPKETVEVLEKLRKTSNKSSIHLSSLCASAQKEDGNFIVSCYLSSLDDDLKKYIASNCYDINPNTLRLIANNSNEDTRKILAEKTGAKYQEFFMKFGNKDIRKIVAEKPFTSEIVSEPRKYSTYIDPEKFFNEIKFIYDKIAVDNSFDVKKAFIDKVESEIIKCENSKSPLNSYKDREKYFNSMIDSLDRMKRDYYGLDSEYKKKCSEIIDKINSFKEKIKEEESKKRELTLLSSSQSSASSRMEEEAKLKSLVSEVIRASSESRE